MLPHTTHNQTPNKKRKLNAFERLAKLLEVDGVPQDQYTPSTDIRIRKQPQLIVNALFDTTTNNDTIIDTTITTNNVNTCQSNATYKKGCRQCQTHRRRCNGTSFDCKYYTSDNKLPQLQSNNRINYSAFFQQLHCNRQYDFLNNRMIEKLKHEYSVQIKLYPYLRYTRLMLIDLCVPNWYDNSIQQQLLIQSIRMNTNTGTSKQCSKVNIIESDTDHDHECSHSSPQQYFSQPIGHWDDIPVIPNLPRYIAPPSKYKPLQSNKYKKRTDGYTSDYDDTVDRCTCKPPKLSDYDSIDDMIGCTDTCVLRNLQIECTTDINDPHRTCPTGTYCSNQQFQHQQYRELKIGHTGIIDKGYGLYANEDIHSNEFIIEYVGDVIDDDHALDKRTKQYTALGQHVYLMTLSEYLIIDATQYGNVSRYLNHSCQPNCRIQRWTVNGRYCMGLFAIRHITAGDELTFDYRYERFSSDNNTAQQCYCGSEMCRGILGGKTLQLNLLHKKINNNNDSDHDTIDVRSDSGIDIVNQTSIQKSITQIYSTAITTNTDITKQWAGLYINESDQTTINNNKQPLYLKSNLISVHKYLLKQHVDIMRATNHDDIDVTDEYFTAIMNDFNYQPKYTKPTSIKTNLSKSLQHAQSIYSKYHSSVKPIKSVDLSEIAVKRAESMKKTAVRYRRHTNTPKTTSTTVEYKPINLQQCNDMCHHCQSIKYEFYSCDQCYTDKSLNAIGNCDRLYCIDCVHNIYNEQPYLIPLHNITTRAWCCPACRRECKCEICSALHDVDMTVHAGNRRKSRTATLAAKQIKNLSPVIHEHTSVTNDESQWLTIEIVFHNEQLNVYITPVIHTISPIKIKKRKKHTKRKVLVAPTESINSDDTNSLNIDDSNANMQCSVPGITPVKHINDSISNEFNMHVPLNYLHNTSDNSISAVSTVVNFDRGYNNNVAPNIASYTINNK